MSATMVALVTRAILILQFAAALLIAIGLHRLLDFAGLTAGLLGALAVVLVRLAINANNFRMAWHLRSELPWELRLNAYQTLKMVCEEFAASMLVSSWHMPFTTVPDYDCPDSSSPPVLLVHGYGCNAGYWHSFSKRLRKEHINHRAISLEPVFGRIEDFVPAIRDAIETICLVSGREKVVIVAHSMGGVAARAYLCTHGANRIAKIITVGSPHHGTGLAHFAKGENSRQMRWIGSARDGGPCEWLSRLAANEDAQNYRLFVSIYSRHDNIVAPQESARLPGARNIALHGVGHVALGLNRRVQDRIIEEISMLS